MNLDIAALRATLPPLKKNPESISHFISQLGATSSNSSSTPQPTASSSLLSALNELTFVPSSSEHHHGDDDASSKDLPQVESAAKQLMAEKQAEKQELEQVSHQRLAWRKANRKTKVITALDQALAAYPEESQYFPQPVKGGKKNAPQLSRKAKKRLERGKERGANYSNQTEMKVSRRVNRRERLDRYKSVY